MRHVWPKLPEWLAAFKDTRFQPYVDYTKQFLIWCGLLTFACELGSRRQIDYELRELEGAMLDNLNRLAGANQDSLPVHKTLAHAFIDHFGIGQFIGLQTEMVRWLIRTKVLDVCRLMGRLLIAIDGTGYVSFKERHCPRCLRFRAGNGFRYGHHVLEAKIVGPGGLAISIAHEMIENPEGLDEEDYDKIKQDCELKAFLRLAAHLIERFPHLPICLLGDAIFACGPAIGICETYDWKYVFTFKEGRTPLLWKEFNALHKLCSQNSLSRELPDKTRHHYRWVNGLHFDDSTGCHHDLNALEQNLTSEAGSKTFAWVTNLAITQKNVTAIADHGGHGRWIIENQGFNRQKNSGLNLEHAYSLHPDGLNIFYTLLQIAHMIMQLLVKGSLLKKLAQRYQKADAIALFGSLKNIAKRLLECLRNYRIPDAAFDPEAARHFQLRLDTS